MSPSVDLDLWLKVLSLIEPQLARGQFITWFKDTTILGREGNNVVIGLPLPMFLNWHLEHYRTMTITAIKEVDPTIDQVVYQVDGELKDDATRTLRLLEHFPDKKRRKLPGRAEVRIAEGVTSKLLNPRYTLENYVVGPVNRLAHAACPAVAGDPGGKYNPLFIYGGVGLGKTHLLQATGNAILRTIPHAVVLYTTSEDFTNQVIEAIHHNKMEQFRRRYREVDVFHTIDDIQFLANKERTQEELFHTFNTLTEERKQIVISSDRPPKELTIMQDRLVSRFERGMVADVTMPDYETRYAILAEKAQAYGLLLEDKVLRHVAEHATKSIRQLEGILMQAVAQYELEHCVPTVRSMTDIMAKLCDSSDESKVDVGFVKEPEKAIAFQDVLETVSRYFSVSIPDMLGDSRVREILIPRQIAMYIGKKHVRMSFVRLGATFSNRDHTTVMNAVEKIETKMKEDGQLLREVRTIEREVGIEA